MAVRFAAASLSLAALIHGATVSVDPQTTYQDYDGTGCSEAFQRSLLVYNLAEDARTEVLDLLFTEKGAGLTILRNGIGSTPNQRLDYMKSIAPRAPASNDSEVCGRLRSVFFSRNSYLKFFCEKLTLSLA